jgi:hypothetical protein
MRAPFELIEAYNRADKYAQDVFMRADNINGISKGMGNRKLCVAHISFKFSFAFYN